jgi:hypothetical protein
MASPPRGIRTSRRFLFLGRYSAIFAATHPLGMMTLEFARQSFQTRGICSQFSLTELEVRTVRYKALGDTAVAERGASHDGKHNLEMALKQMLD